MTASAIAAAVAVLCVRDESVLRTPMGLMGISWKFELLLCFRGIGKENGNGLVK